MDQRTRGIREASGVMGVFLAATMSLHGWIDGYYSRNTNDPEPKVNFFSGIGTTAHRANEPALNIVALDLARDPKPVGFHLTLVAGDSADVVHSGEPHPHRHPLRNIYQASVTYEAPVGRGLLVEAGIYPSHIGFEGFFTKDNWNYTRGWLGELSPYYQTGIKAAYAWNDRWSGQVHVLRGWQLIGDNNSAPAFGTQIAFSGSRLGASFNTFIGPELPRDDRHLRKFGDVVATWKTTAQLTIGASVDRGRQEYGATRAAIWLGLAAYARYALNVRHAIAARAERFNDRDAGISGVAQALDEGTLTYEFRPSSHWILKFEGRRDRSTAPVFAGSNNQTLAIVSAVAAF
ncbi:MAG TPA: porin [Thermoanaerobaculia bacterium]|nr:porin [Thermoanaerobaculia bacterium]